MTDFKYARPRRKYFAKETFYIFFLIKGKPFRRLLLKHRHYSETYLYVVLFRTVEADGPQCRRYQALSY